MENQEIKTTFPKEDNALTRTVYAYVNILIIRITLNPFPWSWRNRASQWLQETDIKTWDNL